MELKNASAGTLESGDIFIQIAPTEGQGLDICLDSTVAYQFGTQIRKVITETLQELGIENAEVKATDKGALDCTIRAHWSMICGNHSWRLMMTPLLFSPSGMKQTSTNGNSPTSSVVKVFLIQIFMPILIRYWRYGLKTVRM